MRCLTKNLLICSSVHDIFSSPLRWQPTFSLQHLRSSLLILQALLPPQKPSANEKLGCFGPVTDWTRHPCTTCNHWRFAVLLTIHAEHTSFALVILHPAPLRSPLRICRILLPSVVLAVRGRLVADMDGTSWSLGLSSRDFRIKYLSMPARSLHTR